MTDNNMSDNFNLHFALHNYSNSHQNAQSAVDNLFLDDFDFGDEEMQNNEEQQQNNEEQQQNDEHLKDEHLKDKQKKDELELEFENEQDAEATITTAFNISKEQFGVDTTRDLILKCAAATNITLFKTKPREGGAVIPTIDVEETRGKIARFTAASLDTNITMKSLDSIENILDNCLTVNQHLTSVEAAKEISQVRCFAYLHKLHENIEAAKASGADFKDFLSKLKTKLQLKSAAQVSKLRRKVKRVNELVDTVDNVAGAYVLGMYITVHCLENEKDANWNEMIAAILEHTEYLAFSMGLTLGADGVTPLLVN
ncbi:unnamed protein product [Mucor fragilis]